ncbi:hypothetical protein EJP82_20265 [Paenibacillus anaericanus]|uniref:Uncharacterized protein n=1 Tax=Paenibacillus anaericanus TaxID=170367 RepID=A0A433Y4G1_9BACL|nr:hypothetical protein EJP82_20265 [Paenibacillus anaericanus]
MTMVLFFSSTNLDDWTRRTSSAVGDFNAITTNGSKFVAVGSHGSLISSNDGQAWTSSSISINIKEGELVKEDLRSKRYKGNPNRALKQSDLVLSDVIWDGNKFIAVGALIAKVKFEEYFSTINPAMLLSSTDGVKWTARRIEGTYGSSFKIVIANNQYFIFPGGLSEGDPNYTGVRVSKDLLKWNRSSWTLNNKEYTYLKDPDILDIAYNGKMFVTITGQQSHYLLKEEKAQIFTSTNGINWTESKIKEIKTADGVKSDAYLQKSISSLNKIIWNGQQFIAINSHTNAIYALNSAGNELLYYGSMTFGINNKSIYWDGSNAVAVGEFGSIYTSNDLKSWIEKKSPFSGNLNSIAYTNGRYMAVGNLNSIIESYDGLSWNSSMNQDSFFENYSNKFNFDVIGSNGTFWIIDKGSLFSADGLRYSSKEGQSKNIDLPDGVYKNFKGYSIINNTFVGIFQSNKEVVNEFWQVNLDSVEQGVAEFSQDTTNKKLHQLILTNGKTQLGIPFVTEREQLDELMYKEFYNYEISTDGGQTWKKTNYKGKNEATISAFGKYIDFNGEQIYTSVDGIKWTKGNQLRIEEEKINIKNVTSIATNGKLILATSELSESSKSESYGDSVLWMSTNGTNWSMVKLPTKSSLQKVIWDGSKFIIVGDGATVVTGIPNT